MPLLVRSFAGAPVHAWRNGLGETSELVDAVGSRFLLPGDAWRLSVAALRAPAPFSVFPGLHRTFVPSGGDVVLRVGDDVHELVDGTPLEFEGRVPTTLLALSQPCHAVNLMCSGPSPELVRVPAGTRADDGVLVVLDRDGASGHRFDLVRLEPGEVLQDAGLAVR